MTSKLAVTRELVNGAGVDFLRALSAPGVQAYHCSMTEPAQPRKGMNTSRVLLILFGVFVLGCVAISSCARCAGKKFEQMGEESRAHIAEVQARERAAASASASAAVVASQKRAVDEFDASELKETIAAAEKVAAKGNFLLCDRLLSDVQKGLDLVRGSPIEATEDWKTLGLRVEATRKRFQKQIDKAKEAEAKLEAKRGPVPDFEDGACGPCERHLKRLLNDPGSFQHAGSTIPLPIGEWWEVTMSYRARNAFGGLVLESKKFQIQADPANPKGHLIRIVN